MLFCLCLACSQHLADLNNMFIEKEEDMVIRLEALQAGAKAATQDEQRCVIWTR